MFKIEWNKEWLRKKFCDGEVKKGRMLIIWRDVDDKVQGWEMSADEEMRLLLVAKLIERTKLKRLKDIVGIKKGEDQDDPDLPH